MSTVSGSVTRESKAGTKTKVSIANKTKGKKKGPKKKVLIPPAKSAEFITKLKALAKQYNLGLKIERR